MATAVTQAAVSWGAGTGPERPVLVLVHGFGANEQHLAGVGRAVGDALGVDWAALRAPEQVAPDGYAWFPITTPGRPAPDSVEAAAAAVDEWVAEHIGSDVPVIGIGFSQGGTVVSHLMRTRFERWPALALLGSFVLPGKAPCDAAIRAARAPVFSGRGTDDTVIATDAVARTDKWLAANANATVHSYRRLGHAVSADEVMDLAHWVAGVLPTLG